VRPRFALGLGLLACALVPAPARAQAFVEHAALAQMLEPAPNAFGAGVAFFDHDGDGWEDLAVAHGLRGVYLYRNGGPPDFPFDDVTREVELPVGMVGALGSAGADLDRDGDQDLVILDDRELRLFRWDDGAYVEITDRALPGLPWLTSTVTFADVDADGWTDLYVSGYTLAVDFPFHECAPSMLLRNRGDGTFEDVSARSGTADIGCGLTALFSDYDRDGDPDLFVGNDYGMFVRTTSLYRNDGPDEDGLSRFADVSAESGANRRLYNMGLATADVNDDGWPDYFGTSIGRDVLLLGSEDGVFTDATEQYGVGAELGFVDYRVTWGCRFLDVEQDGLWDLYIASGYLAAATEIRSFSDQPSILFAGLDGVAPSVDRASELDIAPTDSSRSVAVADFDDDGDDDLATGAIGGDVHLYRNEVGAGPALRVFLRGTVSSPEAYGAWLRLECPGVRREREVSVGGALASSSSPTMRMPLVGCEGGGTLTVSWPSGLVESFAVGGASERLDLEEPQWIDIPVPFAAADGVDASSVVVTPRDADGSLLGAGHVVTVTATGGTVSAVTDRGDGSYAADVVADAPGDAVLSVAIDGLDMPAHPRIHFFPDGGDATSVYVSPAFTIADETEVTVTVVPRDAAGRPDGPGHDVTFVAAGAIQDSTVTDHLDGAYSATFQSTGAGAVQVDARVDAAPRGPSAQPASIARIDPDQTTVRLEPGWIAEDAVDVDIAIQVGLRDGMGNIRTDAVALPYELVGANGPVPIDRVGNRSGGASVHVFSGDLLAGCPCDLVVDGVSLGRTIALETFADDEELFAAIDPAASRIGPFIEAAHADGQDYVWVYVELRDAEGDALPMTPRFSWASDRMTLVEQRLLTGGLVGKARMRAGLEVGHALVDVTFDGAPVGVQTFVDLVPAVARDLDQDRIQTCLETAIAPVDGAGTVDVAVSALDEHDLLRGSGYPLALFLDGDPHPLLYLEPGKYLASIDVPAAPVFLTVQTEVEGTGRGSTLTLEVYDPAEGPVGPNRPRCADVSDDYVRFGEEPDAGPDAGVDGGTDAGIDGGPAADAGGDAAVAGDAGGTGDAGAPDAGTTPSDAGPSSGGVAGGCGCRLGGRAGDADALAWLAPLLALLPTRRRRERP